MANMIVKNITRVKNILLFLKKNIEDRYKVLNIMMRIRKIKKHWSIDPKITDVLHSFWALIQEVGYYRNFTFSTNESRGIKLADKCLRSIEYIAYNKEVNVVCNKLSSWSDIMSCIKSINSIYYRISSCVNIMYSIFKDISDDNSSEKSSN